MKREIKFRAWIPSYEQMLVLENTGVQKYDCENGFSLGFTADGYSEIWAHENYGIVEDAVIMQFTGLHDKNGKEIYEGDVVKVYGKVLGKIIFKNAGFLIEWIEDDAYSDLLGWYNFKRGVRSESHDYEVIGNIYENSELIQQ